MKRFLVLAFFTSAFLGVNASEIGNDSLAEIPVNENFLRKIEPSYSKTFYQIGTFKHWFFGVHGGVSSFIGSPVGCGDFFDRTSGYMSANIGTWFTPSVASRIAVDGWKFKDSNLNNNDYVGAHIDIMYNLANAFRRSDDKLPTWDFMPYIGTGLAYSNIKQEDFGKHYNFMLAYGIHARYRVAKRLHLSAELGGFTSFANFDGVGSSSRFGDNILNASLGLTVTLGKPDWKRAIDADPYIAQSKYLLNLVDLLRDRNESLRFRHSVDKKIIDELYKILELEGLLDKYGYLFNEPGKGKNTYKGLVSLRNRLKGVGAVAGDLGDKSGLRIPINFFFKIGKAVLTENSQMVNLDELAKVIVAHNLKIDIISAADKATGTKTGNEQLSRDRTQYIAKELKNRGVPTENMHGVAMGGIEEYSKPELNRYSRVVIYLDFSHKGL